jgi:Zn-finger nucleic acid-binding protein
MSERQGIEIDYCSKCRGVWLDRGELDKIIERSVQDLPQAAPRQPESASHPRRDHDDYKRHRHKSWLSELFD